MEANEAVAEPSPKRSRSLSAGGRRCNFFVAIQVTNPEIHRAVRAVQHCVVSKKPLYKSVLIKLITLHITLCTLSLPGDDDIRRAKKALKILEKDVKDTLIKNPIHLKFKGIGTFKNEVVFAKVETGEPLTRVKNIQIGLLKALTDEGIVVTDDFSPHLTIMKMSRDKSLRKKGIFKIPRNLYAEKDDLEFGDQTVRAIQFLRIGDHAENTYYNCYHSIDLVANDDEMDDHIDCCGVKSVTPTNVIELPPQEIQGESMSTKAIEIVDSDVGGRELLYRAATSEDDVPRIGDVKLNPDALEEERKTAVPLKHDEGVSSELNASSLDKGKVPAVIEEDETGQGDVGSLGPVQHKQFTEEKGSKNVIDGGDKPEVKSKAD